MASSGPDRSISSKSYIPQWMKSKINDRYDLEQSMAFSPPNNDDGFFLLKNKRHDEPTNQPKPKIVEAKFAPKLQTFDEHPASPPTPALSASALKHFMNTNTTPREVGMRHPGEQSLTKFKSSSEDSTKEGPLPLGSSSIVAVAHQMIADKNHEFPVTELVPPRLRVRRNSKSLPASPQTSPKTFRKNPFFTNIFFGSSELVNVAEESSLTVKRTISTEDARLVDNWSSRVARAFSDGDSPPVTTRVPEATTRVLEATTPAVKALKAKPSELREMNFWSPTSM